MSFLLDTNICSAYLKRRRGLSHRFIQHSGRLHIGTVILGELYTWAYRRADPAPTLKAIADELVPQVRTLDFDSRCADQFGQINATLLNLGHPTDAVDVQIAATAIVHDLTLITHNTSDFRHVPGLRIDDWLTP